MIVCTACRLHNGAAILILRVLLHNEALIISRQFGSHSSSCCNLAYTPQLLVTSIQCCISPVGLSFLYAGTILNTPVSESLHMQVWDNDPLALRPGCREERCRACKVWGIPKERRSSTNWCPGQIKQSSFGIPHQRVNSFWIWTCLQWPFIIRLIRQCIWHIAISHFAESIYSSLDPQLVTWYTLENVRHENFPRAMHPALCCQFNNDQSALASL